MAVWMRIGEDAEAYIERWNNKEFRNFMSSRVTSYLRGSYLEPTEEESREILCEGVSRYVLLGIRGNWTDNGRKLEYCADNMVELFRNYPDLLATVMDLSQKLDALREQHLTRTVDNLTASIRWSVRWGGKVKELERMKEAGIEVEALKERPALSEYETVMLEHFNNLVDLLKTSFQFSEMESYCRLHGIADFDERAEVLECMSRMRSALLDERSSMDEEGKVVPGKPSEGGSRRRLG